MFFCSTHSLRVRVYCTRTVKGQLSSINPINVSTHTHTYTGGATSKGLSLGAKQLGFLSEQHTCNPLASVSSCTPMSFPFEASFDDTAVAASVVTPEYEPFSTTTSADDDWPCIRTGGGGEPATCSSEGEFPHMFTVTAIMVHGL